ncbi:leucine-rich repeat domain-containing protein [uncultured Treponema sp.]|uniref:leucine-rich repeat domain-containing protein n=1 Tax=uncultured Treponema sp. TaxID=162155 RepID=UPI00280C110F|nr:leucine-rich repeat domain-containing protein [uncultured Treponema sp.]
MGNVADCIAKTDRDTLSQMQEALWALQQSYPDARIILDLSGTDDLTAVPADAFNGRSKFNCENLSGIILPQSVKSIGSYAFNTCKNLVDVVLPKTLDSIGYYAFFICDNLSEIVIPEGIQELDNIFQDCKTLKKVSLPSSLRKLSNTFRNCSSLEKIVIPEGVEVLGCYVFYNWSLS